MAGNQPVVVVVLYMFRRLDWVSGSQQCIGCFLGILACGNIAFRLKESHQYFFSVKDCSVHRVECLFSPEFKKEWVIHGK